MPSRRQLSPLPLLILLLALAAGPAAGGGGGTINAHGLVRLAYGALGDARRLAGSPPPPTLRQALDDVDRSLGAVAAAFARPGPALFRSLALNSRAASRLAVVWDRAGADPAGRLALGRLTSTAALLRGAYGWEGVRHRQGGPLTPEEGERLRRLQEAERRLAIRLAEVGRRARGAGDRASADAALALAREARRSADAPPSLDAYLAAHLLADVLPGEMEGNRPFVRSSARKVWSAADEEVAAVEDLSVADEDVGFIFATGLGTAPPGGWGFLQRDATVPPDLDLGEPGEPGEEAAAALTGTEKGDAEAGPAAAPEPPLDEAVEEAGTPLVETAGTSGEEAGTPQAPQAEDPATACGDDGSTCTGLEPEGVPAEPQEVPAESTEPTAPPKVHPAKPPARKPGGLAGKAAKPAPPPAKPPL